MSLKKMQIDSMLHNHSITAYACEQKINNYRHQDRITYHDRKKGMLQSRQDQLIEYKLTNMKAYADLLLIYHQ